MKKSKLLAVCLIGILMAVGLVLASCGSKCDNDGKCTTENRISCGDESCAVLKAQAGIDAVCDC
jgi:hypothetical protein